LDAGSVVSDLGTYYGASALALSYNPDVMVTTYDIFNVIPQQELKSPLTRQNISMKVMSCQLDLQNISKSHLVLLDIDPHDGPTETKFIQLLLDSGFRGILLCDDIFLSDGMTEFWLSIPPHLKKVNVSRFGHWTGTGAVVFDPSFIDLHMVEPNDH
jgi:predicted O-methyltransferase YrrM